MRTQDLPGFLARLIFNPVSRDAAWAAVKAHWSDLMRDIPTAVGAFTGTLGVYCDPESKKDIEAFFAAVFMRTV